MLIAGIIFLVLGVILFIIGWILNTQTPIQQPLPVVGVFFIVIGLVCWGIHAMAG